MGNCQAAEAATVVIQHPEGKVERLYWPTTAQEVMKSNPGHHVALVINTCIAQKPQGNDSGPIHRVRVKLLKPNHILLIGRVYRLVTQQEVEKVQKARKENKVKRRHVEDIKADQRTDLTEVEKHQEMDQERQQHKGAGTSNTRTRKWQPSLRIILEDGL